VNDQLNVSTALSFGKTPRCPLKRSPTGPQSRPPSIGEGTNLVSFSGFELPSLVCLALKLVTVSTELARLPNSWENNILSLRLFMFALFWYFIKLPSSILWFPYSLLCAVLSVINQVTCSHGTCFFLIFDNNFSSEISSMTYSRERHWNVKH